MTRRPWAAGVLVCALLAACAGAGATGGDLDHIDGEIADHSDEAVAEVAAGFDALGFGLLDALRADAEDEPNVVLSPLSAGAALSLVTAGAGDETAEELARALGIDPDAPADGRVGALLLALGETDDVDLTVANALWVLSDYPLTEEFRTAVGEAMGASLHSLDLADADEVAAIDEWVDERTNGLIEEITDGLGSVPGDAVMVLVNATHFAGDWVDAFDPSATREGEFTRDDGSTVQAELMAHDAEDGAEVAVTADPDRGLELARLPYGDEADDDGGRFGFEVLVPTDDTPIAEALDDIGAEEWRELSEAATVERDLRVVLPRFAVESAHDLSDPLSALGVSQAFSPDSDFTPMSPKDPWLGDVAQKAVIEVDETGTEAAAVTAAEARDSGPQVDEVVVDRSFAFAVRDTHTGAALFLGLVDDPTDAS